MAQRQRKFWGWGWEDVAISPAQQARIEQLLALRFGLDQIPVRPAPRLDDITLRSPRVTPPAALAALCHTDPGERAGHTYGKSFRDVVRGVEGDFSQPPDVVACPRTEVDILALLDWCGSANLVAIPYGGGSSVVGGVEAPSVGDHRGVVSIDLRHLDQVLEVDSTSRAARIQAGIYGPALEAQLRPHGYTLRHFPQSFEFSTLGGWIATRSGGHYATLYTHIDDFVESVRCITPTAIIDTRRLPGSGAGPSPDRMLIGSEGIFGIITEAWMRLQERPRFREAVSVTFADFSDATAALRALSQSGLFPSNCRILDPAEALVANVSTRGDTILLLAFESADHPVTAWMARALQCCRDHNGQAPEPTRQSPDSTETDSSPGHAGAAGAWRNSFLMGPYLRDALVLMGMITETFETAVTWDRFPAFHAEVLAAVNDAVQRVCGAGQVTCRITHAYPDGLAPYYTVIAPSQAGSQLSQWDEIKAAAAEALLRCGGTITHHHAVGRDHRPWYDQQCPEGSRRALTAMKHVLDPQGLLNPGVLVDPA